MYTSAYESLLMYLQCLEMCYEIRDVSIYHVVAIFCPKRSGEIYNKSCVVFESMNTSNHMNDFPHGEGHLESLLFS